MADDPPPLRATRRSVLLGIGAAPVAKVARGNESGKTIGSLHRQWLEAMSEAEAWGREWGELEARLLQDARPSSSAVSTALEEIAKRENEALRRAEALAFEMFEIPTSDVGQVVIKLAVLMRIGEAEEGDEEFPWPQLRRIASDLREASKGGSG